MFMFCKMVTDVKPGSLNLVNEHLMKGLLWSNHRIRKKGDSVGLSLSSDSYCIEAYHKQNHSF